MPIAEEHLEETIATDSETKARQTEPLVSVIVPCGGQLEYTRLCVPNLLRHSRMPSEFIFVDMGSLDGTAEFLAGVATASSAPVCVVFAGAEVGFAAAYAQGLTRVRGEFVVLLRNDVIVTENWLNHLVALAEMAPDVGLVGAMTNHVASHQSVGPIPYSLPSRKSQAPSNGMPVGEFSFDLAPLHQFAAQWKVQNRGQWFEADSLEPFCLLMRRQVLASVGLSAGDGSVLCFDSRDLCHRVRQAGYRLACCRDLFIHQFAGRPSSDTTTERR